MRRSAPENRNNKKIEILRGHLQRKLAERNNDLFHDEVLEISRRLDKYIIRDLKMQSGRNGGKDLPSGPKDSPQG